MDQHKLRTLVFEKTGVRIDVDDPVFALVALNEAVLAEAVERHVALLDQATRELADQVQALQDGGQLPPAGMPGRSRALSSSTSERRTMAIAACAAVLAALLVLAGQAILPRPVPATAALSPEQASAIAHGEQLARAVEKLDDKSRRRIQAEIEKH